MNIATKDDLYHHRVKTLDTERFFGQFFTSLSDNSFDMYFFFFIVCLQALFSDQSLENSEKIIATTQTAIYQEEMEDFIKPHTLQDYSMDHFLPPTKRTLSKALSSQVKRRDKNAPWAFTKVFHCVCIVVLLTCNLKSVCFKQNFFQLYRVSSENVEYLGF